MHTLKKFKALEQGMIGDDKDFSGKVCVKWKDTEFERQALKRKFDSARRCNSCASNRQQP